MAKTRVCTAVFAPSEDSQKMELIGVYDDLGSAADTVGGIAVERGYPVNCIEFNPAGPAVQGFFWALEAECAEPGP